MRYGCTQGQTDIKVEVMIFIFLNYGDEIGMAHKVVKTMNLKAITFVALY